jgi:DNA-binding XRE family transcriptional regulator
MNAYDEMYLAGATANLGDMFDYAINDLGYDGDTFMHMFVVSGIAAQFARGNVKYLAGKSGFELADAIVWKIRRTRPDTEPVYREGKTAEYWAGWILAQYQWQYAAPFPLVQRLLPFSEILKMYPTLHEADVTGFFEAAGAVIKRNAAATNLRRAREIRGLSQAKLARKAGVNLRSIQMYEQRGKDINKAQAMTLASLARALGCGTEDLLETIG